MPHAMLKTAQGIIVNHLLKYSGSEFTDQQKQQYQQQYLNDYPGISPTYYTKLDLICHEMRGKFRQVRLTMSMQQ